MKLWDKGTTVNKAIEEFTVGKDRELDLYLSSHDILGSMAHVTMLASVGLLEEKELPVLLNALSELHRLAEKGELT
ncbi:MAG: argininosuccinate lyase, partial [Bacteroidales bacterium]|nr:argininosuccinate lyase [Bacteroidales bacterium]